MARLKIDYGIDLGTTNSAICRMEKGKPVVKKIEVTDDTMPSCVFFNKKKGIVVGASAYRSMKSDKRRATKSWATDTSNTYVEVKRTMGTDKSYHSSNMDRDYSSEELSAEILKALKSFITDESFRSVVITVPAKFTVNQKTATMQAAKMAGFDQCELLQEPIAAAMAYGLTTDEKDGYWMVFDFGGGTFDAALLKVEDGIIQVFDTEGDNYLGGKNLDYAIVDNIIIPYVKENYSVDEILTDPKKKEVLRDAMKTYAEDVKNQLSFKSKEDIISNLGDLGEDDEGEEIELDITLTQEQVFAVMQPLFQKAVDICKTLLARNGMTNDLINKLILVGGPTHSPLIREMLKEQITEKVDYSIDPMTAVATGAALYASTKDIDMATQDIQTGTIRLDIGYESTSVETTEFVSIRFNKNESGANTLNSVFVELVRGDQSWASGKKEIGVNGDVIDVQLKEGCPNSFSVLTYDSQGNSLPCFPEEFTIIQGTKIGSAPLPYHIGFAVWSDQKKKIVFVPAKGLEKNKPLPAKGVLNNQRTSSELRPGVITDFLQIPVYQADEYRDGASANLYEHVADVIVTGADVNHYVPDGSIVDVTLSVDSSEMMRLEVFFNQTDETVEKELDTSAKQTTQKDDISRGLSEAQQKINSLKNEGIDVTELQSVLNDVSTENDNNTENKMVIQHLKEVLRKIEECDDDAEWKRVEKKLYAEFSELEKDQKKYGDYNTGKQVDYLRTQLSEVVRRKAINEGRALTEQIHSLDWQLARVEYYISYLNYWKGKFNSIRWKDTSRARELLNEGLAVVGNNPTADALGPIINEMIDLLPDSDNSDGSLPLDIHVLKGQ